MGSADSSREVFSTHLENLLEREYSRMSRLIGRGEIIVRTGLAILTVLVSIAALTLGGKVHLQLHAVTSVLLALATCLMLWSLVLGLRAQSGGSKIAVTDKATIESMITDKWGVDVDPLLSVARLHRTAINSLRAANDQRARHNIQAQRFQLAFIVVLLIALLTEAVIRLAWT